MCRWEKILFEGTEIESIMQNRIYPEFIETGIKIACLSAFVKKKKKNLNRIESSSRHDDDLQNFLC